MASFLRKYPEVFNTIDTRPWPLSDAPTTTDLSGAAVRSIKTAKSYLLDRPLKCFLQTEGPDKDPTWLQALPNEALRLAMKHCGDVAQGFYKPEIVGALKQPKAERYNVDKFHKGSRVAKRFFELFQSAYDSRVGTPKGRSEEEKRTTQRQLQQATAPQGSARRLPPRTRRNTRRSPWLPSGSCASRRANRRSMDGW